VEVIKITQKLDLTGMTINNLEVIREAEKPEGKNIGSYWLCKCSCGNYKILRGSHIKSGAVKSCGCLKRKKKGNRYDLSNEYGIGYDSNNNHFYFDLENYDKIKNHTWIQKGNKDQRFITWIDNKIVYMHHFVLDIINSQDFVIDHINRKPFDNKKINLRMCSQHENSMNCSLSKNNTTGYNGVSYIEKLNKYRAYIMLNRKQIHLGLFSDINDAIEARKEADIIYFKEFAPK